MKKIVLIFLILSIKLFSANVRYINGNVSYKYLSGACSNSHYEITVTLFTENFKVPINSLTINGIGAFTYTDSTMIGNNVIKSNYKAIRTFPSCGSFVVTCADTINVQNCKNVNPNSKYKFYISTTLALNPLYPSNDSYVQSFSPAIKIFKNKPVSINPISNTNNLLQYDSVINAPYFFNLAGNYDYYIPTGLIINKTSGEIQWANPDTLGLYSFLVETKMYKEGTAITRTVNFYKFEVINPAPSYVYDSINKVPVNSQNFKEIYYTAGNTYSFNTVYTDPVADSVKMYTYPIDFFTTAPTISVIKNSIHKNTLNFSWSPLVADERLYPYNFVLQSISYYPNDSVNNSYQTVSFKSSVITGINDKKIISGIRLYPNPTNGILNISDEKNELNNSTVEITNNIGQTVLMLPFSSSVDVSELSPGCYFMNITTGSKQVMHSKFIKD